MERRGRRERNQKSRGVATGYRHEPAEEPGPNQGSHSSDGRYQHHHVLHEPPDPGCVTCHRVSRVRAVGEERIPTVNDPLRSAQAHQHIYGYNSDLYADIRNAFLQAPVHDPQSSDRARKRRKKELARQSWAHLVARADVYDYLRDLRNSIDDLLAPRLEEEDIDEEEASEKWVSKAFNLTLSVISWCLEVAFLSVKGALRAAVFRRAVSELFQSFLRSAADSSLRRGRTAAFYGAAAFLARYSTVENIQSGVEWVLWFSGFAVNREDGPQ
jgi:hypothetical protein